ncbi:MAG: CDP-alcohol phosphatidyltransferase family protein [Alphaproteobacteria bacterium]|nr:CDP-alcohol phosphatidyltransferase family protein [Alphaproteobacteria bacterium]
MLDTHIRHYIDPTLKSLAGLCMRAKLKPDWITLGGFASGVLAIFFIAWGRTDIGLALIIINRVADGVDGTLARMVGESDRGGFLDIVCDFIFYAGVPLGFAFMNSEANALAAAFVIFSFVGTGSSFLAYAIFAQKYNISTEIKDDGTLPLPKAFFYLGGLTEGTETVIFLVLICLFPSLFPLLAWIFGILCLLTAGTRIFKGFLDFPADTEALNKDLDKANNDVDNDVDNL